MKARWFHKKTKAIELRKRGKSIRDIERTLKIPKSTLSGWFLNIKLTKKQKIILEKHKSQSLIKARILASEWHKQQKKTRLASAEESAKKILSQINFADKNILVLAMSLLYLGEGIKKSEEVGMGNSDPLILKLFLHTLYKVYNVDSSSIRCELYLRYDQDTNKIKKFWSKELNLSIDNFKYVHKDKRTLGSKTFENYKGVCMVRCGRVAIKRELLNISKRFCEEIINKRT